MKTILYVTRHSKVFKKDNKGITNTNDSYRLENEKIILSVEGEERAKDLTKVEELKDVKVLYSSHYTRAQSTAKYIAENNNIKLNVDKRLGERIFGIEPFQEGFPKDFTDKQWSDYDYKLENGESLNEVADRMEEILNEVLDKESGNTIMFVSHGTALSCLFSRIAEVNYVEGKARVSLNGEEVFDGKWDAPELFKLTFEDKKLVSFENIIINHE